jgi:hypothetical protein
LEGWEWGLGEEGYVGNVGYVMVGGKGLERVEVREWQLRQGCVRRLERFEGRPERREEQDIGCQIGMCAQTVALPARTEPTAGPFNKLLLLS